MILALLLCHARLDRASPLTNLSLDVYIPRSQIHFVRLLSREAHTSVKNQAMVMDLQVLMMERLVSVGLTIYRRRKLL